MKHPQSISRSKELQFEFDIWAVCQKSQKVFFFFNVFIFIFGGAGSLLLRQAFSACSGQGLLSVVPSLVSEHGL